MHQLYFSGGSLMTIPMIATVEVRWFSSGRPPSEIGDWFASLSGPQAHQPVRTDYYLKMPGEESLGIKIRDGRIEIKQQESTFSLVLFQRGVVGKVAGWRKWQFELGDPAGNIPAASDGPTCWIPVLKIRHLRRLRRNALGLFEPASPETLIPHGCDLELTQVKSEETRGWTLAIEAYGPETGLYENLCQAAGIFFEFPYPGTLHEGSSLSYPAWLNARDN